MAPDNLKPFHNDAIEAAITRVLEAEAAAHGAVADARAEATRIAERAREQVRRIGFHAERRIRSVRAAFAATTAAQLAVLEAEAVALGTRHDLGPSEIARVDAAVSALARDMTEGAS